MIFNLHITACSLQHPPVHPSLSMTSPFPSTSTNDLFAVFWAVFLRPVRPLSLCWPFVVCVLSVVAVAVEKGGLKHYQLSFLYASSSFAPAVHRFPFSNKFVFGFSVVRVVFSVQFSVLPPSTSLPSSRSIGASGFERLPEGASL